MFLKDKDFFSPKNKKKMFFFTCFQKKDWNWSKAHISSAQPGSLLNLVLISKETTFWVEKDAAGYVGITKKEPAEAPKHQMVTKTLGRDWPGFLSPS